MVHVLRKPLTGSVAENVLAHGTGALHIDKTRIGTGSDKGVWPVTSREGRTAFNSAVEGSFNHPVETDTTLGRWPANLVLAHLPRCHCAGTKQVKSNGAWPAQRGGMGYHGGQGTADAMRRSFKDGEVAPVWDCEPGCPVEDLDGQSIAGGIHGAGKARDVMAGGEYHATSYDLGGPRPMGRFGDAGGASRFFKQVGGSESDQDA